MEIRQKYKLINYFFKGNMNVILDVLKIVVEVINKLVWNVILLYNFYKIINVLNHLNVKKVS